MSKRKHPDSHHDQQPGMPDVPEVSSPAPASSPLAAGQIADTAPHSEQYAARGSAQTTRPLASTDALPIQHTHHILFGAVEDLLTDLQDHGAPDGNIVRVERLVRTRQHTMGGVARQGVLITARRNDEVLSAWVIVGRLALDPWEQPLDHARAKASAERHRDAQRVIGAQVVDAGFAVRTGLYLLPDAGFGFAATSASVDTLTSLAARAAADEDAPGMNLPTNEVATITESEGDDEHA